MKIRLEYSTITNLWFNFSSNYLIFNILGSVAMVIGCTVQGGDSAGVEILGADSSFVAAHTKVGMIHMTLIL